MEKSIEARLEEIFKEWYERMYSEKSYLEDKKEPFTKDGILFNENIPANIIEDMWKLSSRRVLFLLKDQNQKGKDKWFEDIRDWLRVTEFDRDKEHNKNSDKSITQKEKNKNLQDPFMKKLAYLLWGLSKIDKNNDWWEGEIDMHLDKVREFYNTQPFALIECKKLPGGGKVDDTEIRTHITTYKDLLKREIETLEPNIIVCMSGPGYHFALNDLFKKDDLESYGKNVHVYRKNGKETLILYSYHPSHPQFSYDNAMYHYREYLKKNQ